MTVRFMSPVLLSTLLLGLLSLSACAHGPREQRGYTPYPYEAYGNDYRVGRSYVQYGQVTAIEPVGGREAGRDGRRGDSYERRYEGREAYGSPDEWRRPSERQGSSGAGAVLGGVIGGVIGNQMGRGDGRTAATMVGVVAGAVLGNEIERQSGRREAGHGAGRYRVWVRLDGAGEQAFDFERLDGLRVGERVRVVDGRLQRY